MKTTKFVTFLEEVQPLSKDEQGMLTGGFAEPDFSAGGISVFRANGDNCTNGNCAQSVRNGDICKNTNCDRCNCGGGGFYPNDYCGGTDPITNICGGSNSWCW